ncbi:hypothetical protein LGZ99_05740 [Photorhabdus temperata]|uniref:hypothetical protein n=1 Tax=Photorhabdus temperata TaxID=574560 RepID=UPI0021D4D6FF|nr:hypothetical protein [Photorhabdus temperata]MCT8346725.1 hypothetical protein [Photorhabdus temperata]
MSPCGRRQVHDSGGNPTRVWADLPEEYRHSGLRYVTPAHGIEERRKLDAVYRVGQPSHIERWSGKTKEQETC